MIRPRLSFLSLASLALLTAPNFARADLDKEAKEKKDAKAAETQMDEGDHEKFHERLIEEGQKTLEEINKLLEQVQKNLGDQQTGEATQAKQKQISERIEELIKKLDKGCSQCSSSSSGSKKQPLSQKQSQKKDSGKGKKEQKSEQRQNQKQQVQNEKPEQTKEKEQQQGKKDSDGKVENDRKEDGPQPDSQSSKLADQISEARRWGVLPAKAAETMLFSGGKEAPPEYREIISRYYKKLTEVQAKGR